MQFKEGYRWQRYKVLLLLASLSNNHYELHSKSCTKSRCPKWPRLDQLDNGFYSIIQPSTFITYNMKIEVRPALLEFFDFFSQKLIRTTHPNSHQTCKESDSDTDSEYNSDGTASTVDSTTCSWDMLEKKMEQLEVSTNNEILIVSLPPPIFIGTPMGLSASPYEAMVAVRTDKSDLAPITIITVTKINEPHQGRFCFKALFDSPSATNIISCCSLPQDFKAFKLDTPSIMGTTNGQRNA